MSETRTCIVMRRDGDNLSSRGPMAKPMSESDAISEARNLARQFPNQQFVVLAEIASTEHRSHIAVKRPTSEGGMLRVAK